MSSLDFDLLGTACDDSDHVAPVQVVTQLLYLFSFMVLRTKTTVTDSEAEFMAKAIEKQLTLKLVTVILKQR